MFPRNAVKDAAREAVTVNNANNSKQPKSLFTPVQDENKTITQLTK